MMGMASPALARSRAIWTPDRMLIAFLIMLREGIEASLIVGIVASYLVQTDRRQYLGAVWMGVGIAIALCIGVGTLLYSVSAEFPQKQQELFESIVAVVAVVMLTSMVFWMKSAAQSIKGNLHASIDKSISSSRGAVFGLVFLAFLAVGREGLESVFFLLAIFEQSTGPWMPIGALLGVLCSAAIGFLIFVGGVRLNLRRFFRVTGVFIIIVAAGLMAGCLRTLHEAGIWNSLQYVVADWSQVLPKDGALGTVLAGMFGYNDTPTIGEVLIYFAYLVPALVIFFLPTRPRQSAPVPSHA